MHGMPTAARAELLQLDAIGIVPFVLFSVVRPLFAIVAAERNQDAVCPLGHLSP
jgi:hypothetical protein